MFLFTLKKPDVRFCTKLVEISLLSFLKDGKPCEISLVDFNRTPVACCAPLQRLSVDI